MRKKIEAKDRVEVFLMNRMLGKKVFDKEVAYSGCQGFVEKLNQGSRHERRAVFAYPEIMIITEQESIPLHRFLNLEYFQYSKRTIK